MYRGAFFLGRDLCTCEEYGDRGSVSPCVLGTLLV